MPDPLKYNKKFDELNEEEKELLEINKQSIADFVEQSSSISDVNYATRNAHAKTYAVAKGTFWVDKNIPEWVQPFFDNEKFDIMIRFSNAQLKIKNSRLMVLQYRSRMKKEDYWPIFLWLIFHYFLLTRFLLF
ncbi:hypothetical protein OZN48_10815 [Chryseobacterium indologenes]|uniref:hypothetical protein n=1 Tax=Chryseobacterium indologenes TaxID=253 RepID=UPI002D81069E|nr:hypothetical protein [Chryseobacterium indologenes]MEB4760974.1 hypothetical protein [Chryseobacterium indologenes]